MAGEAQEIKEAIEKQGRAWEDFKAANDIALKKGETTLGEHKEKLEKITKELDDAGKEIDKLAKKLAEQSLEAQGNQDDIKQAALDLKQFNAIRSVVGRSSEQLDAKALQAYNDAMEKFIRKGRDGMSHDELKTMSVGSDPDGGYFVRPDTSGRMIKRIFETSDMRSIAGQQTIGTDRLEGQTDLLDNVNAGWVSEQGGRPATGTTQTGKWEIPVHELYAMPEATAKLLEDANVDVGLWLANKVADKMTRMENTAFVLGNGVGKPRGFLTYAIAQTADSARADKTLEYVKTGADGAFVAAPNGGDCLIDLVHKLKTAYRGGARFVMNRKTVGAVRKLKDSQGQYLWLPSMTQSQPATLLGYGISEFEDMPDMAADSLSIAFGDFREGYLIVDRAGIRVIRDELTNKPFIRFYTVKRVGGGVVNFDSIKLLSFGD